MKIADTHQDFIQYLLEKYLATEKTIKLTELVIADLINLMVDQKDGQTSLADMKKNDYHLLVSSVWPDSPKEKMSAFSYALYLSSMMKRIVEISPEHDWQIVQSSRDLSKEMPKLKIILHLEGLDFIKKIEEIDFWKKIGIRSVGLVWQKKNAIATPSNIDNHYGLTSFGKKVVRQLQMQKIAVDLAHLNARGFFDVLENSSSPVIFSHGNCQALCDHHRNITNDQIRMLYTCDSYLSLTCVSFFIKKDGQATIEDLADHFDYAVQIMGDTDYLCFGSDFGGLPNGTPTIKGLSGVKDLPNLLEVLDKRGFKQNDLQKIFHDNALRFYRSII